MNQQADIEIGEQAYEDQKAFEEMDSCEALAIIDGYVLRFFTEEDE